MHRVTFKGVRSENVSIKISFKSNQNNTIIVNINTNITNNIKYEFGSLKGK